MFSLSFCFLAFSGLLSNRGHYLNLLICLEALMLSAVLVVMVGPGEYEPYLGLGLLVVGACEASLGLAVLVALLRSGGSMNLKSC
uniref:NADH-ubiquinone oxidoreductase chain 4L n=1 Tax=Laqueus rubellus TaxID=93892 RepID=Q9MQZ5_LAQRU|nr:NADH dehydrogenase subunit 4L [Laqueus rubellus]BAA95922.1 NADH dehydrogenase subunit 4L [Laqueus rubellus]